MAARLTSGGRRLRANLVGLPRAAPPPAARHAPLSVPRLHGAGDRGAPARGRHLTAHNHSSGDDSRRPHSPGRGESALAARPLAVVRAHASDPARLASAVGGPALDVPWPYRTTTDST